MRIRFLCLYLAWFICNPFSALFAAPLAGWKEIKSDSRGDSDLFSEDRFYVREGSVSTIKSINLPGIVYRRAEFSYSLGSQTFRRDLLVNCESASYKDNDGKPGYWYNMSWLPPGTPKRSIQWIAYTYLCAPADSPWMLIAASNDRNEFWINLKAAYSLSLPGEGVAFTYVVAVVRKIFDSHSSVHDVVRLYVSCQARKSAFYSLREAAGDENIWLKEPNPNSIGYAVIQYICKL